MVLDFLGGPSVMSKVLLGVRQEGRNQHSLKEEGSGLWFKDEAGAASSSQE